MTDADIIEAHESEQVTQQRPASEEALVALRQMHHRRSTLISRNLLIGGKRTSARLEPDMWAALFDIVRREGRSAHEICTLVDLHKPQDCSLTTAIRVFIMAYFRAAATEEGHARAGHGYGKISYPAPSELPRRLTLRNGTNGLPWR